MAKGGFKGGFPGMGGNMGAIMQQAQRMQADIEQAKLEINQSVVEASAGGGVVSCEMYGTHEIKSLTIDPKAVDPEDVEMLQDLIVAAINEANRKIDELSSEKMAKATGGAKLPF
ncbi:MAG TPA: YbaB/EbfC family nucleoid-associated protein [Bacillota bacterium]|nr:YbaB/EbfC family nucleoid-associated protein [Bacillota bacterium]HPE37916.1 YbaB/EbfC family nucleoid-associated protein [Bacillota bacterium]